MSLLAFIIVVSFILYVTIPKDGTPNVPVINPISFSTWHYIVKLILIFTLILYLLSAMGWTPELLTYHIGKTIH